MKIVVRVSSTLIATGALLLTGCTGDSTSAVALPPLIVAGEYSGTLTDSVAGTQRAATTLSQHGAAVGGTLAMTAGSATSTEAIAFTLSGTTLTGSGVMDVNGAACTFAITAAVANNQITGTYSAVSGCAGRTGSLSLSQICSAPPAAVARRVEGVVPPC